MRAKHISSDEQFRFIIEYRQIGLSDYQWCWANDINPGTFYNWINRLRKRGMVIPCSASTTEPAAELQEIVKVDLSPSHEFMSRCPIPNDCPVHDPAAMLQKNPAVEIRLGNSTIRFFHGADKELFEASSGVLDVMPMLDDISSSVNIYVITGYTDMRKYIDGLCAIVLNQLKTEPDGRSIYLFCGKRCDRINILLRELDGYVLLCKRLDVVQGRYRWSKNRNEAKAIIWQQFDWLMSDLEIEQPKALKTA